MSKRRHKASRLAGAPGNRTRANPSVSTKGQLIGAALQARQLRIQESQIEFGIVNHQRIRADKAQQLIDDGREQRLAGEEFRSDPVDRERILRHVALGIDIAVKFSPGRDVVHQLDAGNLDDAMTLRRVEPRGLGVQHDLAHHRLPRRPAHAPAPTGAARPLGPEESDDCPQSAQGQGPPQPGRHDEIGSPPLLAIRHLLLQDRRQANSVMPGRCNTRCR